MKMARLISVVFCLLLFLPSQAETGNDERLQHYADTYARTANSRQRLKLANEFFAFLRQIDYIDEPVVFPGNSHIDSVDVNVYYYVAEWFYGKGNYAEAVDYCLRATKCMGIVDDNAKGDVYSLLGAAYFRLGEFDKAADALHVCYTIDSAGSDYDQLSSTLNNIASVFVAAGKPQEAEKYILEAIAANSLTTNTRRRAVLYGTASEMYKAMGDSQQAVAYASKALEMERQMGDSAKIGVRLSQLANAQLGLAQIDKAKLSLAEAMPMLQKSGNWHSYGICRNQMGDILASKGEEEAAAENYREAAGLFLKQGDLYNELHAREGLYRVMKNSAPNEAMLHLERAKVLQDSIYRHETAETISKYNAIYYNNILQKEKERAVHQKRIILLTAIILSSIVLACIALIAFTTWRKHNSLRNKLDDVSRHYQNLIAENQEEAKQLTEDDRAFLDRLAEVIDGEISKGTVNVDHIASQMHTNVVTLRRRLNNTLGITPQTYIVRVRMQKAKELLENYHDLTIAEVAERCGYSQIANFTRAFRNYYGITPSELK